MISIREDLLNNNKTDKIFDQQLPEVNLMIYPRCAADNILGYFYEQRYRQLFVASNVEKHMHTVMGTGGRDTWLLRSNDPIIIRALNSSRYIQNSYANSITVLEKKYCLGA